MNPSRHWRAAVGLALISGGLGCSPAAVIPLSCGDGTTRDGARCVGLPQLACGANTRAQGGACVAEAPVTCEAGTHLERGACVVDATACGAGTTLTNGRCIVTVVTPPPTRWLPNVRVCPSGMTCYDGQLASDGNGNLVVAYALQVGNNVGVGVAVSTDDGATFGERTRFAAPQGYFLSPSIAATPDGDVYLTFYEYIPDLGGQGSATGNLFFTRSADRGATWAPPRPITTDGDIALNYKPYLTLAGSTINVLFQKYDASAAPLVLLRSSDKGQTFGIPLEVPASAGAYGQFSIARGAQPTADGTLLIPFQSISYDFGVSRYTSSAGVITAAVDANQTLTASQVEVRKLSYSRESRLDAEVVLAVNAAGQRCLAMVDAPSRDYSIFVATSSQAFTPDTKPRLLASAPGAAQVGPSVAVDASGQCHLVWLDNRSGEWALYSAILAPDGVQVLQEKVSDVTFFEDGTRRITTLTDLVLTGANRYALWNDTRDGVPSVYFARGPLSAASP